MTAMNRMGTIVAASALLGWPHLLAAQECTLRLSELGAAITALSEDIGDVEDEITRQYQAFARIEALQSETPDGCPETLAQSRTAAAAISVAEVNAQADQLGVCTQYFRVRLSAAAEQAQAANDSQLMLQLAGRQRHILDAMDAVTDLASDAVFWNLRKERLVAGHDSLLMRCDITSFIND